MKRVVEPVRGAEPARVTFRGTTYLHFESTRSKEQGRRAVKRAEREVGRKAILVRFNPPIEQFARLDDEFAAYVRAPKPEDRPAGIPRFLG